MIYITWQALTMLVVTFVLAIAAIRKILWLMGYELSLVKIKGKAIDKVLQAPTTYLRPLTTPRFVPLPDKDHGAWRVDRVLTGRKKGMLYRLMEETSEAVIEKMYEQME